jgi:hypothetical protein
MDGVADAHLELAGVIHELQARRRGFGKKEEPDVHIAVSPERFCSERPMHIGAGQIGHPLEVLDDGIQDLVLGKMFSVV